MIKFTVLFLLLANSLTGLALAEAAPDYDQVIYSKSSDGPFKGSNFEFTVSPAGECQYFSKACDGPFNCSQEQLVRPVSDCQSLVDGSRLRVALGSNCKARSKLLSQVSDGPFKGTSVRLELTSDCVCQSVYETSDGPLRGGSEVTGHHGSYCREILDQREMNAVLSLTK